MASNHDKTPLSAFLSSISSSSIELLSLSNLIIESSDYLLLFNFLHNSANIKTLIFSNTSFDQDIFHENLLKTPEFSIEALEFSSIPLHNQLNFLLIFLKKCPKLQNFSIKSCDLQENDCKSLCEFLKEKNLRKLDFSRNKFSNIGINELLITLQAQTHILEFLITDNSKDINNEIMRDIERILKRNREVNKENKENSLLFEFSEEKVSRNLKKITEKELEIERIRHKDKENTLFQLREVKKTNENRKKEVLLKYNANLEENSLLQAENQALFQEFQLIQRKNTRTNGVFYDKMNKDSSEKTRLVLIQREEFEFMLKEQKRVFFEISAEYQENYEKVLSLYRVLEERKRDLERRTIELREENLNISMKFEDEIRDLEGRIILESGKSFNSSENAKNDEFLALKNDKKFNKIRHKELKGEIEKKTNRNIEKILNKMEEVYQEKARINKAHHNLSELNMRIEGVKLEILKSEDRIERMNRVLFDLKREIERNSDDVKFEIRREEEVFLGEEDLYRAGKEVLLGKIVGLEEAITRKRGENKRIKEEYQRLSGEINGNLNRVVRDVVNGGNY